MFRPSLVEYTDVARPKIRGRKQPFPSNLITKHSRKHGRNIVKKFSSHGRTQTKLKNGQNMVGHKVWSKHSEHKKNTKCGRNMVEYSLET